VQDFLGNQVADWATNRGTQIYLGQKDEVAQ
jgi:hypothetical protein